MSKVAAMRKLIAWADSAATAEAIDAAAVLELNDEDIEALFRRDRRVVRIPFLGKVT